MKNFNYLKMVMPIVILGQFSCSKEGESLEEIDSSEKTEYVMDISGDDAIFNHAAPNARTVVRSCYYDNYMINDVENRLFQAEVNKQRTFWNTSRHNGASSIRVNSVNAVSYSDTPNERTGLNNAYAYSNGIIWFGESFYTNLKRNYGFSAVAGILAHEWGHQIQFDNGWLNNRLSLHRESEADFFAGYYSGHSAGRNESWPRYVNTGLLASLENLGGSTHGTGSQRRSAARLGWLVANTVKGDIYHVRALHGTYLYFQANILRPQYNYRTSKDTEEVLLGEEEKELVKSLRKYNPELIKIYEGKMSDSEFKSLE